MLTNLLCFALGVVVTVISPPVFRFASEKVQDFKDWMKKD